MRHGSHTESNKVGPVIALSRYGMRWRKEEGDDRGGDEL